MKKIAIEEHFHTEQFVKYLFSRKEWPRREFTQAGEEQLVRDWWSETSFRLLNPRGPNKLIDLGEGRLREMDEAGVDVQVLSLSFPGVELFEPGDGCALATAVNDELSEATKRHPDRFAGFATIAPQAPEAAADELERAVTKLGLKGAMINGHIRGQYLDDRKYWVILERAEALGVPLYLHPQMPGPDMIKPYLAYPGLASAMLGFAAEASLHAMRLILAGVFERYPRLKIILGHLGEALPFWLWRMDSRFEEEKGDPASAAFYKNFVRTPAQCFRENFYVTTSGMYWEPVLRFVSSVFPSDRIMFATDYPYESMDVATRFMETVRLEGNDAEKVAHLNAEQLLGLASPPP